MTAKLIKNSGDIYFGTSHFGIMIIMIKFDCRSQHEPMVPPTLVNHGGAIFNGDHHVLYWADSESEIAFIVPTKGNLIKT